MDGNDDGLALYELRCQIMLRHAWPSFGTKGGTKNQLLKFYNSTCNPPVLFLYLKQGTERIAEYSYDALGRRIERKKYTNDTLADTRRYYYNDSWQELYETNVAGQTETGMRYYVWGNYIDELLISSLNMLDSYWDFYYAHDHLYSPTCLMDSTGSVQERYEYDAYGKVHIYNASWAAGISGWENEYFFTGRRLDILDAGSLKIQYSRNRYYSPTLGRFLSRDPAGYVDGLSTYEYVGSDPLSYIDPMGLNLYAIGGTWEELSDNANTAKFYNNFKHDNGTNKIQKRYYWRGPGFDSKGGKPKWRGAVGTSVEAIINDVHRTICRDFCEDPCIKINLVGWSRGAAIALEVANRLQTDGCNCSSGKRHPRVNWIGLFDAVDMNTSMDPTGTDNADQVDHARKTKTVLDGQAIYPTIDTQGDNVRNQYFNHLDGSETNHNDIGTGDDSYNWMTRRARKSGINI